MIVAEVSIVPIGTSSTSISEYIAASEKILKDQSGINFKIHGMCTELESSNIDEIFNIIKQMQDAQINKGAKRVITTIRIDDRRDKDSKLNQMTESIESKI